MLWLSQALDVLPSLGAWSLCGMLEVVRSKREVESSGR